jgi:hypothetical protein
MEKFAAGCERTNFGFHPSDNLQEGIVIIHRQEGKLKKISSCRWALLQARSRDMCPSYSSGVTDGAEDVPPPAQGCSCHPVKGWFRSGDEFSEGQERPKQVEGLSPLLQNVDNVHACRRGF